MARELSVVASVDWQMPVALLCVALAAVALIRRLLRFRAAGGTTGCHGCPSGGTCSASAADGSQRPDRTGLVSEDQLVVFTSKSPAPRGE